MKHVNKSNLLKVSYSLIGLLILSGCPGNKKSTSAATQNTNQTTSMGMIVNTSSYATDVCTVNANATYVCSTNGVQGQTIAFSSKQQFCSTILNDVANSYMYSQARQAAYNAQNCAAVVNNGLNQNNNTNGCSAVGYQMVGGVCIQTSTTSQSITNSNDYRKVICRVAAKSGGYSGDSGDMEVLIPMNASNAYVDIWSYTSKTSVHGPSWFQFVSQINKTSRSIAPVYVHFYKANNGKADLLRISTTTKKGDSISSYVTGFAGSDVQLNIGDFDAGDDFAVNVKCRSNDRVSLGTRPTYNSYVCKGVEKNGSEITKKILISKPFNDSISDKSEEISGKATLDFEGSPQVGAGNVKLTQNSEYSIDPIISTSADLSVASEVSIKRGSYSVSLKCGPSKDAVKQNP